METIKLDLIPGKKMPSLHASQYDDGREHGIDLFENGVAYKLDGTETLTINERKGDDCICSLDIENTFADTNHIVFASTEQMCAVWGNNICELVIAKGEKTIGTLNFILEIEQSPTEGGIESESEIKNLKRQIEAITEEVIGDNYYTAEETDEVIATATEGKADKTYVDTELDKKADKSNTYTKTQVDSEISRLDGRIDNLPAPMIFKGTLGVGGTIESLPTASTSNEGYTYKVITDGTYAGQTAKVGDVFTSNGSAWVLIPSGDEDNDTWRAIKVEGVEVLGNGISSGAVDFVGSENIEVDFDGNGNKVGVKTKNIYTKAEVNEIVADAIYDVLPSEVASGSVANFETDLALPIKSLEADVNAVQDLHGYDHPWVGGAGKNKLQITATTQTKNGITFTVKEDGSVVINGTATAYTEIELNASNSLKSGTYIVNGVVDGVGNTRRILVRSNSVIATDKGSGAKFSLENDTNVSVSITISNGVILHNVTWYPMIRLSTVSDATFEPYENICPISGWSEISLVNCGKNLWDEEWEVGSIDATTGNPTSASSGIRSRNFIPVLPNTTYFFTTPVTGLIYEYDREQNYIRWQLGGAVLSAYTFTTSANTHYLKLRTASTYGRTYNNNMGINYPSTDTTYHAYNGTTEVINLGGTYYGGHSTQDKDGHRQFEVTHGFIASYNGETINEPWISSEDVYSQGATPTTGAQVVYPLATPIIIDLPDGEPIITLNGTNNIYADTGDSAVEYKVSIEDYVGKRIASVQALTLNT